MALFPGHPLWSRFIKIHRRYGTTPASSCCLSFLFEAQLGCELNFSFTSPQRGDIVPGTKDEKVLRFQSDKSDRGRETWIVTAHLVLSDGGVSE